MRKKMHYGSQGTTDEYAYIKKAREAALNVFTANITLYSY